jgi:hypothetical protein
MPPESSGELGQDIASSGRGHADSGRNSLQRRCDSPADASSTSNFSGQFASTEGQGFGRLCVVVLQSLLALDILLLYGAHPCGIALELRVDQPIGVIDAAQSSSTGLGAAVDDRVANARGSADEALAEIGKRFL